MEQHNSKTTLKEDAVSTKRDLRDRLEFDVLEQVQNEIEEALLLYAPSTWNDNYLDEIVKKILDNTKMVLAALSTSELQSAGALRSHIAQAVSDTKRRIHQGGVWTTNS
jgi:hypothetical protein